MGTNDNIIDPIIPASGGASAIDATKLVITQDTDTASHTPAIGALRLVGLLANVTYVDRNTEDTHVFFNFPNIVGAVAANPGPQRGDPFDVVLTADGTEVGRIRTQLLGGDGGGPDPGGWETYIAGEIVWPRGATQTSGVIALEVKVESFGGTATITNTVTYPATMTVKHYTDVSSS